MKRDLAALLAEVLHFVKPEATQQGVSIIQSGAEDLPAVDPLDVRDASLLPRPQAQQDEPLGGDGRVVRRSRTCAWRPRG